MAIQNFGFTMSVAAFILASLFGSSNAGQGWYTHVSNAEAANYTVLIKKTHDFKCWYPERLGEDTVLDPYHTVVDLYSEEQNSNFCIIATYKHIDFHIIVKDKLGKEVQKHRVRILRRYQSRYVTFGGLIDGKVPLYPTEKGGNYHLYITCTRNGCVQKKAAEDVTK